MSGILFLAHRLPFPPDRGDKIRSHHVLKALAELGPVHVGCFAESAADKAHEDELAEVAASYCLPMRGKPLSIAGIEALARRECISLAAFRHPHLQEWVRRTLEGREIDTIYVFSGQMGQYVPNDWPGRLVIDLVDVDSAKYEAYAAAAPWPMRWVHAREARLLRAEEARLAGRANRTLLVSEGEADLLASRLTEASGARIEVLGNGIDAEAFDPLRWAPHPALMEDGPHFVMTGQMDYAPNVEAARRTAHRLMPRLLPTFPDAQFHVVGRAPAPEVMALEGVNRTRVWGEVPDVRPFLAGASLALAPLTIARGVQNKVLEAMAMARAVLLTSEAAGGIPGEDGVHFAVADTDDDLTRRALELLAGEDASCRMGEVARRLVTGKMSWPAMLAGLPDIVGRASERRDAA